MLLRAVLLSVPMSLWMLAAPGAPAQPAPVSEADPVMGRLQAGSALQNQGKLAEALAVYCAVAQSCHDQHNPLGETFAQCLRSLCAHKLGDVQQAAEAFGAVGHLALSNPTNSKINRMYSKSQGENLDVLFNLVLKEASADTLVLGKVMLANSEATDDAATTVILVQTLGQAEASLGHHGAAIDYFQRMATLARKANAMETEADAWVSIGKAHLAMNHPDQAREQYQRALGCLRMVEGPNGPKTQYVVKAMKALPPSA
jgi:tetratricopeptide (TPR) repeat protein